jgi:hypothetical protein
MTPIGQPCVRGPFPLRYFVFVQSVCVFVELTLAVASRKPTLDPPAPQAEGDALVGAVQVETVLPIK